MSYTNADGLYVRTFRDQGAKSDTGTVIEPIVKYYTRRISDATAIGTAAPTPSPDDAFIPSGAVITRAYIVVDTAFTSGGSAALNVGLYQADGTAIDADGIDATVAVAALSADAVIECDGADVGTKVGANDAYIEVDYDTAAFTAGAATVVVEYFLVDL